MANFDLQTYTIVKGRVEDVVDALETKIETITSTKTIRLLDILQTGDRQYIGVVMFDSDTPSSSPSASPSASISASPSASVSASPSASPSPSTSPSASPS